MAVMSRNVAAIGYAIRSEELYVRLHHAARIYAYSGVLPSVYKDFLRAPSKGQYLNSGDSRCATPIGKWHKGG
jgi:hypothetical protein